MTEISAVAGTLIFAGFGIAIVLGLLLIPTQAEDIYFLNNSAGGNETSICADVIGSVCYDSDNIIGANTIYINGTQKAIDVDIDTSANTPILEGINYGGGAQLIVGRANGNFGSPTAVTSNNQLGTQQYFGYDGDSFDVGASINSSVCNGVTFSNTDHCAVLNFNTVGAGSTTSTQRAQITEFGYTGGKIDYPITTINTTPYNAVLNDYIILCDASFFSVTINLPTPNANDNRLFMIKRTDTNAPTSCIVATAGTETIDGSNTITLTPITGAIATGSSIIVAWDGSNWWIVG